MTRFVAIFLANLAVVAALSANAVIVLVTGCSIGGTCGAQPGATTWALAVGPSVLLAVGTLWMWRAAKKGALTVKAVPASDVPEADVPPAKAPRQSSAQVDAEVAAIEDAARSRLSRVVANNSRLAESDATGSEPRATAQRTDLSPGPVIDSKPAADMADVASAPEPLAVADDRLSSDEAEDELYDEFLDAAEAGEPVAELPTAAVFAPQLVTPPGVAPAGHDDNWMWLIDPARPHHLAANAVTGFPWIAGTIDLFAATLVEDPHFAADADLCAEAAAWLEITATLPPETAIEPADGQAFVDWANSHVGDKGRLLTPLIDSVMAGVRAEALHDPSLAALLPPAVSATRPDHDDGAMPLARAG